MSKENQRIIWSYIIGNTTLCIQCAQILLDENHEIFGIITSDPEVKTWSEANSIPCHFIQPDGDIDINQLYQFLKLNDFDNLFSIVNPLVLPENILDLPREFAVNYHDSLLPKYAGVHATSWAIINREKTHGITWHIITGRIDAGDILKQKTIEISENETALTLNTKCYEAAADAFSELLMDLSSGQVHRNHQDLSERSFFPRHKLPAAVLLDWSLDSGSLVALVRSMDFGPYPNLFAVPKMQLGSEFIIVTQLSELDSRSNLPPGTIVEIYDDYIQVSTGSYDMVVGGFHQINGLSLHVKEVIECFNLLPGNQLPEIDTELVNRIGYFLKSIRKSESFWVTRLSTLETIEIPIKERNSSKEADCQFRTLCTEIPENVENYLQMQKPECSPVEFLLCALVVYLARITGTYNFSIGYRYPELVSKTIDCGLGLLFSSVVPLCLEFQPTENFQDALTMSRTKVLTTKNRTTFSRDVLFRYPELRSVNEILDHLSVIVEVVDGKVEMESLGSLPGPDLTIRLHDSENGGGKPEISWIHRPSYLSCKSANMMEGQFLTLLEGIIRDPEQEIRYLPLLPELERHKIFKEWSRTRVEHKPGHCIHTMFEDQVTKTPEALAVIFPSTASGLLENSSLTYDELNCRSNQLAHYLRKLGVRPEVIVGICVERSLDMVVGILGILKAGGAYVPLDPNYPTDRLKYMIDDIQVDVLLTQSHLVEIMPRTDFKTIYLDSDLTDISRESNENPDCLTGVNNLAYVIYTSGTTGKPKGVLIEHGGLCNLVETMVSISRLKPGHRILHMLPISFDASSGQMFIAICSGATLILANPEVILLGTNGIEFLRSERITCAGLPPSLLATLEPIELPDLSILLVGAEPCPIDLAARWAEGRRLFNVYGPTETTIGATLFEFQKGQKRLPIGKPHPNVRVYVLDCHQQVVPIGLPGELYISGVGVARGYHNLPGLTAMMFLPDPFSDEPGGRIYRTGDLVRWLPNGNLEFIERVDEQVKIRGFRIELGEVEAAIKQHPDIREAVVLVSEPTPTNKRLVGYIVNDTDSGIKPEDLRSYLRQKLPNYMIPSLFIHIDSFPMTPNSKIDRRALRDLEPSRPELGVDFIPPRTVTEKIIAGIWQEVLSLDQVGVYESFFELGGDSLTATQIISRVISIFDIKLPLMTFFEQPNIIGLSEAIDNFQPN